MMVQGEYHRTFCERFQRYDLSAIQLKDFRKRQGWKTGRTGYMKPGYKVNFRGVGAERIGADGRPWIIIEKRDPWLDSPRSSVHKHKWLWEQKNGPTPEGMVLKCLDGNKLNSDPENWEAVPKSLVPHLIGMRRYDAAPAELKSSIMANAKLAHAISLHKKGGDR